MIELGKESCRCEESFYWNLTQPYFQFEKGKYYQCNIREHEEGVKVYSFDFCDWVSTEEVFLKFFITIDEIREEKLKKILGN
jgi:hypothetical protein